jgi:hypothetical protein
LRGGGPRRLRDRGERDREGDECSEPAPNAHGGGALGAAPLGGAAPLPSGT